MSLLEFKGASSNYCQNAGSEQLSSYVLGLIYEVLECNVQQGCVGVMVSCPQSLDHIVFFPLQVTKNFYSL